MSIRNLFFRESECKKPSDSPFPCGLRASHPFWRPAPLRVAGFGLRFRCAACSPSVLRTLFGGLPRFASRASDCGSPFRAVLVLGASHPFWRPAPLRVAGFGLRFRCAACSPSVLRTLFGGPPRFASQASDCAAAARRARPRCFAPFLAACPASRRRLRTAVALSGPSSSSVLRTLFAACPALRRGLRTAVALSGPSSSSVLRTLFGKQKPRAEARGVMIPFWFPCFENQR